MNSRLIVFVAAGVLAAPHAMAQFKPLDGVEFNVYGRVYLTVESVESKGGSAPMSSRSRVSDNSSRLGIRAEKGLGGGVRAWGQLETGFKADDTTGGTNTFSERNSGVGLLGTYGTFLIGRWDTPFKQTQVLAVDPWDDLTIADMTGTAIRQGGFSNRASNVVQYWSPALAGLVARLAVTSNEGKSDAAPVAGTAAGANPRLYGGSLEWASGPFFVAYAYEKHQDSIGNLVATQGTDETGHGVSGKYTIAGHEISAQYGQYSRTDTETQKSWMLGLRSTFGVHQVLAAYRRSNDGGMTGTEQPRCDSWGLSYKYLFDKNLDFILLATKVHNKTGGLCDFGSNTVGAAATADGGDPRGIGAGLRYAF